MTNLDPHERPPDGIRAVYKKYQKMKSYQLALDPDIVDLPGQSLPNRDPKIRVVKELDPGSLQCTNIKTCQVGLHIIPSLLPSEIQLILLSRLLHRDLSHPSHLTNIHNHYNVSYPPGNSSFFTLPPNSPDIVAHPIDPSIHRPVTTLQLLNKKMRWVTLGGQYDWTKKNYPNSPPPPFPSDIGQLLEDVFTDTKAEAAIVNLYSPGDTLSMHRDVAESSATGLISVSLGCDAVFIIGTTSSSSSECRDDDAAIQENVVALRLRSGSAVYMSGPSRFAWHGVPQIIPGTCPEALRTRSQMNMRPGEAGWRGRG
ncbi:hypothetical protein DM02DRAFT_537962 [Periconia macrospinosa]|uniref:Fe2OG dioxygenase domain-containing protein n=1 Tax=Periconia macrospinosa TaxID=97972 RepID=A0A2V1DAT0_9PLEO|nr:hypothetical protein DM02DRAFT_537962 [Periconia macrospinosa]